MNTPIIVPLTPVTLASALLSFFSPRYSKLNAPNEKVSALIPAYNEEKNITHCIDSLICQTEKPEEIIVSNNGSTDATKQTVDSYLEKNFYTLESIVEDEGAQIGQYKAASKPNIIVIEHKSKFSKSDSINFAKSYVKSPRTMVLDSDTNPLSNFIEEASKCFYVFYKGKKSRKPIVEKISAVCGTVLTNYSKDAGWQEKLISRARSLEYNTGQFLTKLGQNKLALYVISGCGFIADTSVLEFNSKTVTEDMNFTWVTQCKHKKDRLMDLEELKSLNLYTQNGKSLSDELRESGFDNKIILRDKGRALYQPSAFVITQDPKTLKGLLKQLERWKGGLHQNILFEGKKIRKSSSLVTLISHAAEVEGTLSSIYCYGLPLLAGLSTAFNIGINPKIPLGMMGTDFLLRSLFAEIGSYRCKKQLKEKRPFSNSTKETLINLLPYYTIEFLNSAEFLKSQVNTAKDYLLGKRSWDPSWERVDYQGKK